MSKEKRNKPIQQRRKKGTNSPKMKKNFSKVDGSKPIQQRRKTYQFSEEEKISKEKADKPTEKRGRKQNDSAKKKETNQFSKEEEKI